MYPAPLHPNARHGYLAIARGKTNVGAQGLLTGAHIATSGGLCAERGSQRWLPRKHALYQQRLVRGCRRDHRVRVRDGRHGDPVLATIDEGKAVVSAIDDASDVIDEFLARCSGTGRPGWEPRRRARCAGAYPGGQRRACDRLRAAPRRDRSYCSGTRVASKR
jgi:hypothetical protein